MEIDVEKFHSILSKEIRDLKHEAHIESRVCIGEIDGIQIILVVTQDEDAMEEAPSDLSCILP